MADCCPTDPVQLVSKVGSLTALRGQLLSDAPEETENYLEDQSVPRLI